MAYSWAYGSDILLLWPARSCLPTLHLAFSLAIQAPDPGLLIVPSHVLCFLALPSQLLPVLWIHLKTTSLGKPPNNQQPPCTSLSAPALPSCHFYASVERFHCRSSFPVCWHHKRRQGLTQGLYSPRAGACLSLPHAIRGLAQFQSNTMSGHMSA